MVAHNSVFIHKVPRALCPETMCWGYPLLLWLWAWPRGLVWPVECEQTRGGRGFKCARAFRLGFLHFCHLQWWRACPRMRDMRNRPCQLQPVAKLPHVTPLLMSEEMKYYCELLRSGSLLPNLVAETWLSGWNRWPSGSTEGGPNLTVIDQGRKRG